MTWYEILRWNDEEMDGKFYKDWTPFNHPVLGHVDIGGEKGTPPGYGEQLETVLRIQYDWLMHVASLSPQLRIRALRSERLSDRRYRITAAPQNEGFLSTYVARWGKGADESTKTVEWIVSPDGRGAITVSVEAWAYKAGRDESSITISR